ncbi:MAG: hypothetical protein KBB91_02345 [Candidatus Pacebacteria bacterium]|nr:hypothetical protein [Candidatus Paceibacterota bacterium]MBP9701229.1 hypothetical protein [Candidatus Paceibacterota bacterium]
MKKFFKLLSIVLIVISVTSCGKVQLAAQTTGNEVVNLSSPQFVGMNANGTANIFFNGRTVTVDVTRDATLTAPGDFNGTGITAEPLTRPLQWSVFNSLWVADGMAYNNGMSATTALVYFVHGRATVAGFVYGLESRSMLFRNSPQTGNDYNAYIPGDSRMLLKTGWIGGPFSINWTSPFWTILN